MAECPDCGRHEGNGGCMARHLDIYFRDPEECRQATLTRLRARITELEAETMTLASERDTARMGQDEWRSRAGELEGGMHRAWEEGRKRGWDASPSLPISEALADNPYPAAPSPGKGEG